ncbi:hypothetical protein [Nocardia blacklockiae]|uniref:hypothetical protein n=1 Tax=Nocardia blacklockiae TaxID=480036 RepID=UPI00189301F3|nr:hypothetical protein [Nocardia blacklockiae]MBF6176018.1 hypothetical protein [Nocardia blacklockiae]
MVHERTPNLYLAQHISDSGWTRDEVAEFVNDRVAANTGQRGSYTDRTIRRLLDGRHTWPHPPYRQAMCELFECTPAELGFFNPRDTRTARLVQHQGADVRRDEFLLGLAALPVVAALPPRANGSEVTAKTTAPMRVGSEHVDQVKSWTALFRQADDAGLNLAEGMQAQLHVASGYRTAQKAPHVARELDEAIATFHRVVGWAHYDRGQHQQARENFRAGYALIADQGAWWLRAAILTCAARQAIYCGDIDDALNSLGVACLRPDKLSLLRRADIAAVKARAFGRQGNHAECIRSVLEAESLFSEAGNEDHPDTQHEGFKDYYTAKLLNSDLAQGLFELSYTRGLELSHTLERLDTARRLSDEHARSRVLATAHLAQLHLRRGDVDQGVELATKVLDKAQGMTSARVTDDVKRIRRLTNSQRIKQATGVPELRRKTDDVLRTL